MVEFMDYGEKLGRAWQFAFNLENIKPYVALYAVFALIALVFVAVVASAALGALGSLFAGNVAGAFTQGLAPLAGLALALFLLLIVFIVANALVDAAVITRVGEFLAKRKTSWKKCFDNAFARFWSVIGVVIIVAVIAMVVGSVFAALVSASTGGVKTFTVLLQLIANALMTLAFVFAIYSVVLAKKGAVGGVKESVGLFLKNPLEVLIALIVLFVTLIAIGIGIAIPVIILAVVALTALKASLALTVLIGLVVAAFAVCGAAFLQAFKHGLWTNVYLELSGAKKTTKKRTRRTTRRKR